MLEYVGQANGNDEIAAEVDHLIHPSTRWPAELNERASEIYRLEVLPRERGLISLHWMPRDDAILCR